MKTPKLSIMIPTYNSADYLKEAVNSVLAQDYTDYELIVVDNASTDNTEEVIRSYESSKIRYYKNEKNLGPQGNLNKCMTYARGEYLRHLCADDVLLPGILEKQIKVLDEHPQIGLVTCDMIITDENLENGLRANFYPGFESGRTVIRSCCFKFRNWIGGPSNVMFRREAATGLEFNGNLKWISDLVFYSDILEKWDFCNVNEVGYYYRRHSAADTFSLQKLKIQQKEELDYCLSRHGFHSGLWQYLKCKIPFSDKAAVAKKVLTKKNLKIYFRAAINKLADKSVKAPVIADYFGCYISSNIAYSNVNGILNIGKGTSIHDFTVIRIENGPGADYETSSLIIGNDTYIGEHNNIRAAGGTIRIGNNVLISQMVTMVASNHGTKLDSPIMSQPWERNTVVIEDDVWIGAGSVILPGVHIGKGSIIAANSVVRGLVQPFSVMAGAPAKKVKERV